MKKDSRTLQRTNNIGTIESLVNTGDLSTTQPSLPTAPCALSATPQGEDAGGDVASDLLPVFSPGIMRNLPRFLKECLRRLDSLRKNKDYYNQFSDIMILTIIAVMSGALPNVRIMYRRQWFFASISALIVAISAGGKSIMDSIFELITPIHKLFRDEYKAECEAIKQQQRMLSSMTPAERRSYTGEILEKALQKFFLLPVDSTYAAFIQILYRMDGMGAMLDTEIDDMVNAFMSDLGNYSVLVRKNFSHEKHTYFRKGEDEYIDIPEPKFCSCLSGTMDQLRKLVNNALNGFFSRYCYYISNIKVEWQDAESDDDIDMDDKTFFRNKGEEVKRLYLLLRNHGSYVRFRITAKQLDTLNSAFGIMHSNYVSIDGEDIHSVVVRMAIIMQRIAMVLTMMRLFDKTDDEIREILTHDIICSDTDFNTAMQIAQVLLRHAASYYEKITDVNPNNEEEFNQRIESIGREDVKQAYDTLPTGKTLDRGYIINHFVSFGVPRTTAEKYIKRFLTSPPLLHRVSYGKYRKLDPDFAKVVKQKRQAAKKACKTTKIKK